jgi:hypothetical protein
MACWPASLFTFQPSGLPALLTANLLACQSDGRQARLPSSLLA